LDSRNLRSARHVARASSRLLTPVSSSFPRLFSNRRNFEPPHISNQKNAKGASSSY
jgi:hypothetical protein